MKKTEMTRNGQILLTTITLLLTIPAPVFGQTGLEAKQATA